MESKVKKVLHKFADNTSLHGAPRIIEAKTCTKRILWTLFFLGVSALLAYNLTRLILKYLAFEKTYSVDMRQDPDVFPWVTFCQHRAFDIVTLEKIYWLFSQRDSERRRVASNVNYDPFVRAVSNLYDDYIEPIRNPQLLQNYSNFDWHTFVLFHSNLSQGVARFEDVFLLSKSSDWYKPRLIHSARTVKQCFTYHSDIYKFQLISHGYELRPQWDVVIFDNHDAVQTATASFRSKVPPIIDEIFGSKVDSQGIDVFIHPPGTDPEFEDKYIRVLPGQAARIYISPEGTEILGRPYGEPCAHAYHFDPHPAGPYVEASCFDVCIMLEIIKNCACKSDIFTLFNLNDPHAYKNVAYCRAFAANITADQLALFKESRERVLIGKVTKVDESTKCANNVWLNKEATKACKLACPRACVEYTYNVDSTISDDVTQSIAKRIVRDVTSYVAALELTNQTDRLQLLRRHANGHHGDNSITSYRNYSNLQTLGRALAKQVMHVKFDIKVKDLMMPITKEVPDYTIYQLLSDIGGQLGLWLGMSVITILDIFSLVFGLTKAMCSRYREKRANQ